MRKQKKIKKLLVLTVITSVLIGTGTRVALAVENENGDLQMNNLIRANQTVQNETAVFNSFEYNGITIQLFKESTLSKSEVIDRFPNAYKYIADQAIEAGVNSDMDNQEFMKFAKTFAFNELADSSLSQEIQSFAVFMDIYENKIQNESILASLKARDKTSEELQLMMPIDSSMSTKESDEATQIHDSEIKPYSGTYSASSAVTYASNWWNKTNNTSYSYYAKYNGLATNTNNYNDLESGATGQSSTRRNWNDCADFVSQCIKAGGMQYRKGGLLPHQKTENWYYDSSKPSHTWGGAPNFYNHWSSRAGVATSSSSLTSGDAISVDIGADGDIDHTIIIVSDSSSGDTGKLLAQHTSDRYKKYANGNNYSLGNLYNNGYNIYGYEMDKAPIE